MEYENTIAVDDACEAKKGSLMSYSDPPSRRTDPDTSREAGRKARKKAPVIRDVVRFIIGEHGPMTHDEVIEEYHLLCDSDPSICPASDQGIRSRVSELHRAGIVVEDEQRGVSGFGNSAMRWLIPGSSGGDVLALVEKSEEQTPYTPNGASSSSPAKKPSPMKKSA